MTNAAHVTKATPLLQVTDLVVEFATTRGLVRAVDGVSFEVGRGECLAIVGESGSGKTQVLNACLGLLAGNGRARGEVSFQGESLLGRDETAHNAIRGTGIGLLSQDPLGALTPHLRIETQLVEGLLDRGAATPRDARERALRALREVDVPEPEARLRQYPHELSGGMRQRVALAMALMCDPPLLLADEPTTALDASVQARVLVSLARLRERGLAIVLVTHDLGVVAGLADRVAVMYAGRIVEAAPTGALFQAPAHPYTAALLAAVPTLAGEPGARLPDIEGQPPRPGDVDRGCAFAPRCKHVIASPCRTEVPRVETAGPRQVACHRACTDGGWR